VFWLIASFELLFEDFGSHHTVLLVHTEVRCSYGRRKRGTGGPRLPLDVGIFSKNEIAVLGPQNPTFRTKRPSNISVFSDVPVLLPVIAGIPECFKKLW